MAVRLRREGGRSSDVRWGAIALVVMVAVALGAVGGIAGRHYLNASAAARPLAGVTRIQAEPIPTVGPGTDLTPVALPDHVLL